MKYLHWQEEKISDFSANNIDHMYETGFVFTRLGRGIMHQTRSLRIDLRAFELSSENRRILKKNDSLVLEAVELPLSKYDYAIGKLAKDFYDKKFSQGIMSAQKVKEMLTNPKESNFNNLLIYRDKTNNKILGYAIVYESEKILHYCYPFYDLNESPKDMGLGMMILAIENARKEGRKYAYLGSLQRPSDVYKLQFSATEWFDGKGWSRDIGEVKKLLKDYGSRDSGDVEHPLKGDVPHPGSLPSRVHIIGICGVATSALGIAFHKRGVKVTGSDKGFYPPVSTELEKQGIKFYAGWHPEKMFDGDTDYSNSIVIVGTASGRENPEIVFAKEKGLQCYSYPEVIGKYFVKGKSIVCAGTWGKTSSSALLSFILEQTGLDPSYMFGGISLSHDMAAKITDSKYSVFEGDEYKSSPTDTRAKFFHYKPTDLLLTAVSWDHADLYPTEASYFEAFSKLVSQMPVSGTIVACHDNKAVKEIIKPYKGNVIPYGRELPMAKMPTGYFWYKNVKQDKNGLHFIIGKEKESYEINSPLLGLYQAENITGCFAMAFTLEIKPEQIVSAIRKFKGLKRRMEKRIEGNITVIDDIAHSPEKAHSVLNTLRSIYSGKVIAIFEPNSGGRSRESAHKYDNAFVDADVVIIPRLTKLKVAENSTDLPIEGQELRDIISKTHSKAIYIEDDAEVIKYIKENSQKGDVIAFLGSHGFRGIIEEVVKVV